MRLLRKLLITVLVLAPLACVILSIRQESSSAPSTVLFSSPHLATSSLHKAPGISGHWGGALASDPHPHHRSTLAGAVTSWDAYLYAGLLPPSAAPPTRLRASASAVQHNPAASASPSPSLQLAPVTAAAVPEAAAQRRSHAEHASVALRAPSCVLRPSLAAATRSCPRVFSPVCGCNGVVYSNKCESELAGVPHVGGAFCDMSFGQPLVLRGHVRPHAFGPSADASLPAPAPASAPRARAAAPLAASSAAAAQAQDHRAPAAAPSSLPSSVLALLRRERNKLIERVRRDRRAISRLQSADAYEVQVSNVPYSKGLLSARAAVDLLHAQDKAARKVAAGKARLHALRLDEAANRRVAKLLEKEEVEEEHRLQRK